MAAGAQAESEPLVIAYPFMGRWMARRSPARRVPSHGTHLMGTTYAIDFIPVDARGRSAPRSWRAAVATEAPENFVGFGAAILAPCSGRVVIAHDDEPDHEARRSQLTLLPYLLSQASRVRGGPPAIAGNHVVIASGAGGPFILLAHLRRGSLEVGVGDDVQAGATVGACGNSGNSTQPHVHVQATDSTNWSEARGLPIAFKATGLPALPREGEIVTVDQPGSLVADWPQKQPD
ncbi:MAG: M23 family metallopeptidase [Nocardioidaceae bacterium]|nr:M23 family metallopeptidase [Nocardioidaceae bacterium]